MFAPRLAPILAERSLVGAAAHALSVRAMSGSAETRADVETFVQSIDPAEMAQSTTAYAVSLTWWARDDRDEREALLARGREILMGQVSNHEHAYGYTVFCADLARAALAADVVGAVNLIGDLTHYVDEVDRLTVRFADAAVRSLLLADPDVFGPPTLAPEFMRDTMTAIAYAA